MSKMWTKHKWHMREGFHFHMDKSYHKFSGSYKSSDRKLNAD